MGLDMGAAVSGKMASTDVASRLDGWLRNRHQNRAGHIRHTPNTACPPANDQLSPRSPDYDGALTIPCSLSVTAAFFRPICQVEDAMA